MLPAVTAEVKTERMKGDRVLKFSVHVPSSQTKVRQMNETSMAEIRRS